VLSNNDLFLFFINELIYAPFGSFDFFKNVLVAVEFIPVFVAVDAVEEFLFNKDVVVVPKVLFTAGLETAEVGLLVKVEVGFGAIPVGLRVVAEVVVGVLEGAFFEIILDDGYCILRKKNILYQNYT